MSVQTSYSKNPSVAFPGVLYDVGPHDIITGVNRDVISMPFGTVVAAKTSSPTSDFDAILPASSGAYPMGIVVHSHDYARVFTDAQGNVVGELDSVGLKPGAILQVLRKGRIWVLTEDGSVLAFQSRLYTRYSANGGATQLGACRGSDDSGHAIDLTKLGQFITSQATVGGLVVVEVDFTVKP
jgi:hypothetical protein